jgi:tRNA dimethylallyltransferase
MMKPNHPAVAVMGATATGKSDLGIRLAEEFGGEIISMDSRQLYRGFDIGTGKVSRADRERVRHHLVDILEPQETSSAGSHLARVDRVWTEIAGRGKIGFFVGGTGLYFRVLFHGIIEETASERDRKRIREELSAKTTAELHAYLFEIDPARAAKISPGDRVRIARAIEIRLLTGRPHSELIASQSGYRDWKGLKIVLTLPRELLRRRIAERTHEMYKAGWVDEVRSLLGRGIGLDAPAMGSLGYGVIARAILEGEDPASTLPIVVTLTQQYAKRQETFFRSESDAHWIDMSKPTGIDEARRLVAGHIGL